MTGFAVAAVTAVKRKRHASLSDMPDGSLKESIDKASMASIFSVARISASEAPIPAHHSAGYQQGCYEGTNFNEE